jgi:hypothetical protein
MWLAIRLHGEDFEGEEKQADYSAWVCVTASLHVCVFFCVAGVVCLGTLYYRAEQSSYILYVLVRSGAPEVVCTTSVSADAGGDLLGFWN